MLGHYLESQVYHSIVISFEATLRHSVLRLSPNGPGVRRRAVAVAGWVLFSDALTYYFR